MNDALKKKWIIVAAVWFGVVLFSAYNFLEIRHIKEEKHKKEILKMDARFIKTNSDRIERISQQENQYHHEADSLGMGLLLVENHLRRLAASSGFREMDLKIENEEPNDSQAVLNLFITGALVDLIPLLSEIKSTMPYLTVHKIDCTFDESMQKSLVRLHLYYQYRISGSGEAA